MVIRSRILVMGVALVAALLVVFAACSKPAPTPSPTPAPKPPPASSPAASPKVTAKPAASPSPVASPKPAPSPTAKPTSSPSPTIDKTGWPKTFNIGTTSTATASWHIIATGMCGLMSKYMGVSASPELSGGDESNIHLIGKGDMSAGFISTITGSQAGLGIDPFKDDKAAVQKNLRFLTNGHNSVLHVIGNKSIKTPADFRGKSWAGYRAGTTPIGWFGDAILKAYGMVPGKDVKMQTHTTYNEQAAALKEGGVQILTTASGIPGGQIVELAMTFDCTIVPIGEKEMAAIIKEHPYFVGVTIPKGTYKGQDTDVLAGAWITQIAVSNVLPESFVYELMKAIYNHTDEFYKVHPSATEYTLKNAVLQAQIPWHKGVIKYLKEKGAWTSELEAKNKELLTRTGQKE